MLNSYLKSILKSVGQGNSLTIDQLTIIMIGYIILLLPALSFQCSDFWVSECHLDQDEVILKVPLPGQDDALTICQDLCNVQFDCTYW